MSFILASIFYFNLSANLYFESASINYREYLIDFSIDSNDIYKTRVSSRETARTVFDISENTFNKKMCFLLKDSETIIGFFALKTNNDDVIVELSHLFVKAGFQKKGYGSFLFSKAVEISKSLGYSKIFWISDPDAANFYLKKGAKIIGHDQNFLNPKVDVLLFELLI